MSCFGNKPGMRWTAGAQQLRCAREQLNEPRNSKHLPRKRGYSRQRQQLAEALLIHDALELKKTQMHIDSQVESPEKESAGQSTYQSSVAILRLNQSKDGSRTTARARK